MKSWLRPVLIGISLSLLGVIFAAGFFSTAGYGWVSLQDKDKRVFTSGVLTGIDVLEEEHFTQLKQSKRRMTIGLLTNQTGLGCARQTHD
jgi:hypothetical protein